MIKQDKRKYSICVVSRSSKDNHFKLLNKKAGGDEGFQKALKEAQRLANQTGKKVTVLTSVFNVYPDKQWIKGIPDSRYCKDQETCAKFPFCCDTGCLDKEETPFDSQKKMPIEEYNAQLRLLHEDK
jgi:hypothetical protein